MIGTNGYSNHSSMSVVLAFIDGFIIILGVLLGEILGFGVGSDTVYSRYSVWKVILVILVIQMALYYFDLYGTGHFGKGLKIIIQLVGAVVISSIFLTVTYYCFPHLTMDKGILATILLNILIMGFLFRFICYRVIKIGTFKERILILGSEELAKKFIKEISKAGQDSFEIVGLVVGRRNGNG